MDRKNRIRERGDDLGLSMQTLGIDANNNLIVAQGSLVVKSDIDACAQDIKTRIGLCQGENPFDLEEGIDFDNEVLARVGGQNYLRQAVRNRIMTLSYGVQNVTSLSFEKENRTLTLTAEIKSTYGAITL